MIKACWLLAGGWWLVPGGWWWLVVAVAAGPQNPILDPKDFGSLDHLLGKKRVHFLVIGLRTVYKDG